MAITVTYLGTLTSGTDTASFSIGNTNPAADGLVVVYATGRRTADTTLVLSGISIGGTAGTLVDATASSNSPSGMYCREVTAGTHAIVVDWNTTALRCSASCFLLEGYASATPYDTYQGRKTSSYTTHDITLDFPTDGVGIYGACHATTGTVSWSSAGSGGNGSIESGVRWACAQKTATGAADVETVTFSTSAVNGTAVGAVWEPAGGSSIAGPLVENSRLIRGGLLLSPGRLIRC